MRVKGTTGGVTTAYMGNYFEWTTSTSTMVKYYYAGIKRVAMSTGSDASLWLMGDHDRKDHDSGSTSVSYDVSSQTAVIERYLPWGGLRDGTNSLTADGPPSINRQRLPCVRIRISSPDYPLRPAFMTFMGSLLSGTENATCQKN